MQVAPSNPTLQALSGAEAANGVRPQSTATRTETVRAVQNAGKSESGNQPQMRAKREPEDDDNTSSRPRGSIIDIVA